MDEGRISHDKRQGGQGRGRNGQREQRTLGYKRNRRKRRTGRKKGKKKRIST